MEYILEHEDVISLAISILCGSIIGFEREYNNKSAGFRTVILICLGSTIFTIVSNHGTGSDDRIAANIITGIGFIGAGVIFKDKLSVLGLTTAAVIWTSAGIAGITISDRPRIIRLQIATSASWPNPEKISRAVIAPSGPVYGTRWNQTASATMMRRLVTGIGIDSRVNRKNATPVKASTA